MATTRQSVTISDHLIDILCARGHLDAETAGALRSGEYANLAAFEKELAEQHGISPESILLALAEHAHLPVMPLARFIVPDDLLELLPPELLAQRRALPLARTKSTLTLALADPLDVLAVEEVAGVSRLKVLPVAALESQIRDALGAAEQDSQQGLDEILREATDADLEIAQDSNEDDNVDIEKMLESAEDAPVIRIVNMILVEAIRKGASDIHIEPFEKVLRLRYRIDGILHEMPAPPKILQPAVTSRIKVMANLNIAERRVPQDGRFRIRAQGREIDLRISILPTVHGEKIVLRLLDKSNLAKDLGSIGLDPDSLQKLRHAIQQPHGLILVTGPTGSGKTTTLYSALQELNTPEVNIVTVENPVEYQLMGINQVEIREQVGLSFAAALRSILRQDPDIVLVGETRDAETADIAVKAALTGHLVMTTLHTNDAPGAIARLAYMDIEPFLIASSLRLSQAQRLVRCICTNCKEPYQLTAEYCKSNDIPVEMLDGVELYHGRGCSRCSGTGYKGRAAIMEVLPISPRLRELMLTTTNADAVRNAALEEGFRDLRTNGFFRVREGITTIEEVLRVTTEN
ncbi:MAG: Flp pilus assembly complex ATPase component [Kiritimatiellaeota bacterium]|nr:Flp pilus assembly complex ATPase component [Kiritimatiellota bacterium]